MVIRFRKDYFVVVPKGGGTVEFQEKLHHTSYRI